MSTAAFVYAPPEYVWVDYVSMVLFGYTVYALVTYLGGLMAVDICSRRQQAPRWASSDCSVTPGRRCREGVGGYLINSHKAIGIDGQAVYISPPSGISGSSLRFWRWLSHCSCGTSGTRTEPCARPQGWGGLLPGRYRAVVPDLLKTRNSWVVGKPLRNRSIVCHTHGPATSAMKKPR